MRKPVTLLAMLLATGCSGSASSTPPLVITHQLSADTTVPLTAPVAIGASAVIAVTERTCRSTARPNGPPIGTTCDAPYAPALIAAVVLPMDNTGAPCPLTAQVTSVGRVTVTRTGPGDPVRGGRCDVSIQDPQTNAFIVVGL